MELTLNNAFINLNDTEIQLIQGGLSTGGLLWSMGVSAVSGGLVGGPAGVVFGACFGAVDYVVKDYFK